MAVKLNNNNSKGAAAVVSLEANEAIDRQRFSASSVQTQGDVYVSNMMQPSDNTASTDWAKLTAPEFGNMYSVGMPVRWIAATAKAYVVSYVDGDF